jgi:hypothetical protein
MTGGAASRLSVTDSKRMIVYARRGGNLRAAGIAPGPVGVAPLPKAGRFRVSPSENLWRVGFALACSTDQVIADLA